MEKSWFVYVKELADPEQLLDYLGRYVSTTLL